MGKYINGIGTSYHQKVAALKEQHGATSTDSEFKEDLVCVVDNGFLLPQHMPTPRKKEMSLQLQMEDQKHG